MGLIDKMLSRFKGDVSIPTPSVPQNTPPVLPRGFVADDFANIRTSQGTSMDKKMWAVLTGYILSGTELDSMYQNSDIVASICDIPANEMLRQGYEIKLMDGSTEDESLTEALKAEMQANFVNEKLTEGEVFSRLYGGAGIFLNVVDGLDPWQPLDLSKIQSVDSLVLLDRYELINSGVIDMNVKSGNFARPDYYTLATIDPRMAGIKIHNSRIVRFDGVQMSRRRMAFFQYWGQSVINRIYNIIRDYESSNSAISSMIQDFNVIVFKMAELASIQAGTSGGQALLQARLNMAVQMQSILNALIIRENEEIDYKTRNVTGCPDLMDRITDRLVIAAKVPRLLLMGQGKGGLNTNTDNEVRMFYDQIKSYQHNVLSQKIRTIVEVFMASKSGPFAGDVRKFQVKFNPLWQMTDAELADVKVKMSQADNVYLANGVLTPDEVAESRFGSGKFSTETILDQGMRGKVAAVNKQGANLKDPNLPKDRDEETQSNPFSGIASASATYTQKKL